jgi:hypothetical protein
MDIGRSHANLDLVEPEHRGRKDASAKEQQDDKIEKGRLLGGLQDLVVYFGVGQLGHNSIFCRRFRRKSQIQKFR